MKHIVWVLFIYGFHENAIIDNFSSKNSCEVAYESIVNQYKKEGTIIGNISTHQCIEVQK